MTEAVNSTVDSYQGCDSRAAHWTAQRVYNSIPIMSEGAGSSKIVNTSDVNNKVMPGI